MRNSSDSAIKKSLDSLVLGTVQFGQGYGIANRLGKPDIGKVREILDLAFAAGIRLLDTAALYGDSETVLRVCGTSRWSIITKVPSLSEVEDQAIARAAKDAVYRSLDTLRIDDLSAVLAHDARDMMGDRGRRVHDALEELRSEGLISRVGVSVYSPEDMAEIGAEHAQIVQAPFNVFDRRFVRSGAAAALRRTGAQVHIRSVFLQGLLLMPASERPARFAPWQRILERYDQRVRDSGLNPAAFCLGFAARQEDVTNIVVGVETPNQLVQLTTAFLEGQDARIDATDLGSDEVGLIDPRFWSEEA